MARLRKHFTKRDTKRCSFCFTMGRTAFNPLVYFLMHDQIKLTHTSCHKTFSVTSIAYIECFQSKHRVANNNRTIYIAYIARDAPILTFKKMYTMAASRYLTYFLNDSVSAVYPFMGIASTMSLHLKFNGYKFRTPIFFSFLNRENPGRQIIPENVKTVTFAIGTTIFKTYHQQHSRAGSATG